MGLCVLRRAPNDDDRVYPVAISTDELPRLASRTGSRLSAVDLHDDAPHVVAVEARDLASSSWSYASHVVVLRRDHDDDELPSRRYNLNNERRLVRVCVCVCVTRSTLLPPTPIKLSISLYLYRVSAITRLFSFSLFFFLFFFFELYSYTLQFWLDTAHPFQQQVSLLNRTQLSLSLYLSISPTNRTLTIIIICVILVYIYLSSLSLPGPISNPNSLSRISATVSYLSIHTSSRASLPRVIHSRPNTNEYHNDLTNPKP